MTCRAWQHLLQQHLDGAQQPGTLEQHLRVCPHCATNLPSIRRLLDGLSLLTPIRPPTDFTDRLTTLLVEEVSSHKRPRRRYLPVLALAAAALVLIALGIRSWLLVPSHPEPKQPLLVVQPPKAPEEPAPLRDAMAQAGSAFARLTTRTASETVGETASLLPLLPQPAIEVLGTGSAPLATPMEPLRQASAGVSEGLSPVTDSARRAVSLFFRDMPLGRSDRPLPPNKPG